MTRDRGGEIPTHSPHIMIVSNGYGEDLIGAKLGTAFQTVLPSVTIVPMPLIGGGASYQAAQFTPRLSSPTPSSGGFIRTPKDAINDLKGGLISTLWHQRRAIQKQSASVDVIVAVGDVFCLLWATAGKRRPTVFLPTAKSDLFMPHSPIECALIRRRADWVFPRDTLTTDALKRRGINAQFMGNPMMDGLLDSPPLDRPTGVITIAILPGSRTECYGNFDLILKLLTDGALPHRSHGWVCLSPQVDPTPIRETLHRHGYTELNGQWQHPNGIITLDLTPHFAAAVQASDCVIGLAGTANEQAAWLGKSVIAFPGTGPQSRPQRFVEQGRLIGPQLRFVPSRNPKDFINAVTDVLSLPSPPRPIAQNAALAIANDVVSRLECFEIS